MLPPSQMSSDPCFEPRRDGASLFLEPSDTKSEDCGFKSTFRHPIRLWNKSALNLCLGKGPRSDGIFGLRVPQVFREARSVEVGVGWLKTKVS